MRDSLFLVRNGVPFDVAFSLEPLEQRAWVIVLGELSGRTWNYDGGGWA